jgi:hypothetical protein
MRDAQSLLGILPFSAAAVSLSFHATSLSEGVTLSSADAIGLPPRDYAVTTRCHRGPRPCLSTRSRAQTSHLRATEALIVERDLVHTDQPLQRGSGNLSVHAESVRPTRGERAGTLSISMEVRNSGRTPASVTKVIFCAGWFANVIFHDKDGDGSRVRVDAPPALERSP